MCEDESNKCSVCGNAGYTEVHHVDKNKNNNSFENLVRLCRPCHGKAHGFIWKQPKENAKNFEFIYERQTDGSLKRVTITSEQKELF